MYLIANKQMMVHQVFYHKVQIIVGFLVSISPKEIQGTAVFCSYFSILVHVIHKYVVISETNICITKQDL